MPLSERVLSQHPFLLQLQESKRSSWTPEYVSQIGPRQRQLGVSPIVSTTTPHGTPAHSSTQNERRNRLGNSLVWGQYFFGSNPNKSGQLWAEIVSTPPTEHSHEHNHHLLTSDVRAIVNWIVQQVTWPLFCCIPQMSTLCSDLAEHHQHPPTTVLFLGFIFNPKRQPKSCETSNETDLACNIRPICLRSEHTNTKLGEPQKALSMILRATAKKGRDSNCWCSLLISFSIWLMLGDRTGGLVTLRSKHAWQQISGSRTCVQTRQVLFTTALLTPIRCNYLSRRELIMLEWHNCRKWEVWFPIFSTVAQVSALTFRFVLGLFVEQVESRVVVNGIWSPPPRSRIFSFERSTILNSERKKKRSTPHEFCTNSHKTNYL